MMRMMTFSKSETVSVDITISVSITIVFHEQTIHNIVGCDDPTRRKCLRVNECVNTMRLDLMEIQWPFQ